MNRVKPPLILLVEDEEGIRKLFASFLESAGHCVLQASNGLDALQASQTQRPDLVVSDVLMPGMDGYELVRRLRLEPPLSAIPVIFISGVFTDEAALRLARSFGVRHFLAKPLSKETLLASVADALRGEVALPSAPIEESEREHNRVLIDKLTEKINALTASEERFRQMAESIGDVFWLSDPASTKIFYVSPAYEAIWGRSCESLYASPRSWADAIHPEDRPDILEGEARQFVTGEHDHTYRIVRPDGGVRWIHDRAFPVRDEFGKIIRVAGLAKDITESKLAEASLRESQELKGAMLEVALDCIITIDHECRITDWNSAAERTFGYSRGEALGRSIAELIIPPSLRDRHHQGMARYLATGEGPVLGKRIEMPAMRADGSEFPAELAISVIKGEKHPMFTAYLRDITVRKQLEREIVARARQQAAVAELGHRALAKVSLTAFFDETAILVASALELELCKVLELLPDKSALKLIAGVGWHDGLVGQAEVGIGPESQAGYTLHCQNPVIVEDLSKETRFIGLALLHDHGVVSGVSVIIGSPIQPWGVLSIHSRNKRTFTKDDINFVQSVASLLGTAIAREKAEQSLVDLSGRLMHVEDAERRRIAKELHDSTAQDLVAVMINLESLRDGVAEQNSAEAKQLEDSIALVENAAHEIRTLSYILHPPRLDEAGLIGAIRHYAAGFGERTGIATSVDLPVNLERLGEAVEIVLFRVVQECLGNIHRHARSRTACVFLKHDASGIVLEVRDQGRGIPPQVLGTMPGRFTGLGVGIPGMRERLRFIGGNLEIDSSPSGTTVRAVVPGLPKS